MWVILVRMNVSLLYAVCHWARGLIIALCVCVCVCVFCKKADSLCFKSLSWWFGTVVWISFLQTRFAVTIQFSFLILIFFFYFLDQKLDISNSNHHLLSFMSFKTDLFFLLVFWKTLGNWTILDPIDFLCKDKNTFKISSFMFHRRKLNGLNDMRERLCCFTF